MSYGFSVTYSEPANNRPIEPPQQRVTVIEMERSIEQLTEPYYCAIGGGLSPSRIVKKREPTAQEIDKTIKNVLEDILASADGAGDEAVAETIRNRRQKRDYMVCINGSAAVPNTCLDTTKIKNSLVRRAVADRTVYFLDIAILSSEEGGVQTGYE